MPRPEGVASAKPVFKKEGKTVAEKLRETLASAAGIPVADSQNSATAGERVAAAQNLWRSGSLR
jgi:hypothetical protein